MQPLQPQVKVVIDGQGNVKMEVQGVAGPSCLKLTRDLEVALSGGVESNVEHQYKPVFHEGVPLTQQEEQTHSEQNRQLEGF